MIFQKYVVLCLKDGNALVCEGLSFTIIEHIWECSFMHLFCLGSCNIIYIYNIYIIYIYNSNTKHIKAQLNINIFFFATLFVNTHQFCKSMEKKKNIVLCKEQEFSIYIFFCLNPLLHNFNHSNTYSWHLFRNTYL